MKTNNQSLKDALDEPNIQYLKEVTIRELVEFSIDEYKNIFLYSVRKCDFKVVKVIYSRLLENDPRALKGLVKEKDEFGRTCLMLAALRNQNHEDEEIGVNLISFILQRKLIDFSEISQNQYTALTWSITRNFPKAFVVLLHYIKLTEFDLKIINEKSKNETRDFNEQYFYTPQALLDIVCSGDENAAIYLIRHIKGLPDKSQEPFIKIYDDKGRHALMLAAINKLIKVYAALFSLSFELCILAEDKYSLYYYLTVNLWWDQLNSFQEKMYQKIASSSLKDSKTHAEFAFAHDPKLDYAKVSRLISKCVKTDQEGRLSRIFPREEPSKRRSFKSERERQILRHIGTQIFFSLKDIFRNPVEVQAMHLIFNDKSFIFIAANPHDCLSGYFEDVILGSSLQTVLETDYAPTYDQEASFRSDRYACRFSERVYAEDGIDMPAADNPEDKVRSEKIALTLRRGTVKKLLIDQKNPGTLQTILETALRYENKVIFICEIINWQATQKKRHAEEFLVDIAEFAKDFCRLVGGVMTTCIGGKKRPCIGCFSRMVSDGIDNFGKHPGRFWVTIDNQSSRVARRTVQTLLNTPSYVSEVDSNNPQEYDSGSDSE